MITRIHIQNFKAIHKSEPLPLQPFTVFIGNNGSGKSSLMEALRVLQLCVTTDLNTGFREWGDLTLVRNFNSLLPQLEFTESGFRKKFDPIRFFIEARLHEKTFQYQAHINLNESEDFFVVEHEELLCENLPVFITNVVENSGTSNATFYRVQEREEVQVNHESNYLLLGLKSSPLETLELAQFKTYIEQWQFLHLNAHDMGKPVVLDRIKRRIQLDYTGRNIAEYLLWLRGKGHEYLDSLIRKMLFVLPYIKEIQPSVSDRFSREIELLFLEDSEKSKQLPGWLLSSGTLRVLALLAMFETPEKPSVLFVDEVENGLDPRTIGLLLEQIEQAFTEKTMQVIVTTHSPYFLDMVPLESVIVCEKDSDGSKYIVPSSQEGLNVWKTKFSPGKLYTMGKLTS
jgi:predicted ATPase